MRVWNLAIRESSAQLRRNGVRALIGLGVLLSVLVVTVNTRDYRARRHVYEERVRVRSEQTIDPRGWNRETALRALRPPSLGSIFIRGVEPSTPPYWDFERNGLKEGATTASASGDSRDVGVVFDLESLTRILFGLLAIVLGVDSVVIDRENGMLSTVLSQPVSRLTVASGKLFGGILTLSLAIASATLAGAATTWLLLPEVGMTAVRDPLPAFAAVSLAYLVTLYAAGMTIGAVTSGPIVAFTIAIGGWLLFTLGAPLFVGLGARMLGRVDSRPQAESRMFETFEARLLQLKYALGVPFAIYLRSPEFKASGPHPQWIRDQLEAVLIPGLADMRTAVNAIDSEWLERLIVRHRWTERLSRAMPSTAFQQAASVVADTGVRFNIRLNEAVRVYQRALNADLFDNPPRINPQLPVPNGIPQSHEFDRFPSTIRPHPYFEPPTTTLRQRVIESRSTMITLLAYLVGSVTLATAVFPRKAP